MAKATITDFQREFPELATEVPEERIELLLNRASRFHNATKAGTLYAAAHLHCLDKSSGVFRRERDDAGNYLDTKLNPASVDGGLGVVKKETIGPKSVEYMTNAGDEPRKAFWATSPYGREFMNIEQRNVRQGFGILIA